MERLSVGGELVDPGRTDTAAFVTAPGVPDKYGRGQRNLDLHAAEALRRHLGARASIAPGGGQSVIPV